MSKPTTLVERAFETASLAHKGQFRNDGIEPYIFHPVRVASMVKGENAKAVALLHDVVEDCYARTPEGMAEGLAYLQYDVGFPDDVVTAVEALTQRKFDGERTRTGEKYFDYVKRAAAHPLARLVKLADIEDNSHTLEPGDSLLVRYAKAKWILRGSQKKDG
jgi:(p)ppGpp synthase/HD superfamily hydrolase